MAYSIYSEFDIQKHKETFKNYLEVLIDEGGVIRYAVPSHQELAIRLACNKHCISRDTLMDMCPKEYYFNFLEWLLMQSGAIAVWNEFCIAPNINTKQIVALRKLKMNGLYTGVIPNLAKYEN